MRRAPLSPSYTYTAHTHTHKVIAYDAYTGRYYWVIEGSQSSIYCHSPPSNTTVIHQFRDNPVSLKLDWVARRLLWVEDGETVSDQLVGKTL